MKQDVELNVLNVKKKFCSYNTWYNNNQTGVLFEKHRKY